jgi:ribosome-associated protein
LIIGKRLAKSLANSAHHKLAFDIELLDVRKSCSYTDFLLIMSGKNKLHLDALMHTFEEYLEDKDIKIFALDGDPQSGWVIIDVGGIMVHVFDPERRGYYNIFSLWSDAESVPLEFSQKPPAKKKKTTKT